MVKSPFWLVKSPVPTPDSTVQRPSDTQEPVTERLMPPHSKAQPLGAVGSETAALWPVELDAETSNVDLATINS